MIARYFFQSFAQPGTEGWVRAISGAEQVMGHDDGPRVVCAVLRAVQAMRQARQNHFHFSNPDCPGCAARLCWHERLFLNVFRAVRRGRDADAEAHAMLLCEGNATDGLVEAMQQLSDALPSAPVRPSVERPALH